MTKFIVVPSHFHSETSTCFSIYVGLWCSKFSFWQIRQEKENFVTSIFMPTHQNIFLRSLYILVISGWKINLLWCPSSIINLLSSIFLGTQILSLNQDLVSLFKIFSFILSDVMFDSQNNLVDSLFFLNLFQHVYWK